MIGIKFQIFIRSLFNLKVHSFNIIRCKELASRKERESYVTYSLLPLVRQIDVCSCLIDTYPSGKFQYTKRVWENWMNISIVLIRKG